MMASDPSFSKETLWDHIGQQISTLEQAISNHSITEDAVTQDRIIVSYVFNNKIITVGPNRHESNAMMAYFEAQDSEFAGSKSHALYLDRIGRIVLKNNKCWGNGWGHCVRAIAREVLIEGNFISNVDADGEEWINPRSGKAKVGMNPIDVQACSYVSISGNTIIYRPNQNGIKRPIAFRRRRGINACEGLGYDKSGSWLPMMASDPSFSKETLWDHIGQQISTLEQAISNHSITEDAVTQDRIIVSYVFNNKIITVGPNRHESNAMMAYSTYPSLRRKNRRDTLPEIARLAQENSYQIEKIYQKGNSQIRFLFDTATTKNVIVDMLDGRASFNGFPMVSAPNWRERTFIFVANNSYIACEALNKTSVTDLSKAINCSPWEKHLYIEEPGHKFFKVPQNSGGRFVILGGEDPNNETPIKKIVNRSTGDRVIKSTGTVELPNWWNKSNAPMFRQ